MAPTKFRTYSEENVKNALEELSKNKMSLGKASREFGVPKSTLRAHHKRLQNIKDIKPIDYQTPHYGRQSALTSDEEEKLVQNLIIAANNGLTLTAKTIREAVKSYLDHVGRLEPRFINNEPGEKWVRLFFKRHGDRLKISRSRSPPVAYDQVLEFLTNTKEEIMSNNIEPQFMVNYQEANITYEPNNKLVIVESSACSALSHITHSIMFSGTASGVLLPPHTMCNHTSLETSRIGADDSKEPSSPNSEESEKNIFEEWFFEILVPYFEKADLNNEHWKLVVGDDISAHISIRTAEYCESHKIRCMFLPVNTSSFLHPLGVSYMKQLKSRWRKTVEERRANQESVISKEEIPELLETCLVKLSSSKYLQSGFKAAGIYPPNNHPLSRFPEHSFKIADAWSDIFTEVIFNNFDTMPVVAEIKNIFV